MHFFSWRLVLVRLDFWELVARCYRESSPPMRFVLLLTSWVATGLTVIGSSVVGSSNFRLRMESGSPLYSLGWS